MKLQYSSPVRLDMMSKVITMIIMTILLVLCLMPVWYPAATLLVSILSVAVLVLLLWDAPLRVGYYRDCLYIRKVAGHTRIPFADIEKAQRLSNPDLSWRVFGSGGFMGYFGIFRNRALGKFKVYVGCPADSVLLTMNSDTFRYRHLLFSCDSPDDMLDGINAHLNKTAVDNVKS